MNSIDKLYKRIMKHDPKVVDDTQTLDEAKEIIKNDYWQCLSQW